MSFYRRDFSPSKHKNVLCIVSNKDFFLWWWDDCTWSSLSPTVKAVTSEKIKHKKGLVYWPSLPLQKMYCNLCVLSQNRNVFSGMRFISKLAYLRRRSLSSRHWFGCGLSKCEVDSTSMLLDSRAGALKRMFSFQEGISQWFTLVDAVNRIWWENSCIDCITLLIYINLLAPKFYI
jgi:hypothetical protein